MELCEVPPHLQLKRKFVPWLKSRKLFKLCPGFSETQKHTEGFGRQPVGSPLSSQSPSGSPCAEQTPLSCGVLSFRPPLPRLQPHFLQEVSSRPLRCGSSFLSHLTSCIVCSCCRSVVCLGSHFLSCPSGKRRRGCQEGAEVFPTHSCLGDPSVDVFPRFFS